MKALDQPLTLAVAAVVSQASAQQHIEGDACADSVLGPARSSHQPLALRAAFPVDIDRLVDFLLAAVQGDVGAGWDCDRPGASAR